MQKNKFLITIIAPVKDEKENIAWTIEKIKKFVKSKHEILIIYDLETDKTLPVIKDLQKKHKFLYLLKNQYGCGVLNAIKTGINKAKGETIVIMAVDRTDDPKIIDMMYQKITEGYDIICPTRYSKGGRVVGKKTIKSFLSRLSGLTTPYILGIPTSDLTYSFKMFKKGVLKKIKIESKGGFEFAEELLIKAHFNGFKIIEVPTLWIDRAYGKSKFKLMAWLPRYLYWYFWGFLKRIERS